jgi:hypothetical protein
MKVDLPARHTSLLLTSSLLIIVVDIFTATPMKATDILLLFCAIICGTTDAFQSSSPKKAIKGTSLQMTVLTYGGKKKNFKPGSPLKSAASALGVKPKYSCKKGDCGSCTLSVGGQRIKACVGKVPPEPKLKSLQEKGLEIR